MKKTTFIEVGKNDIFTYNFTDEDCNDEVSPCISIAYAHSTDRNGTIYYSDIYSRGGILEGLDMIECIDGIFDNRYEFVNVLYKGTNSFRKTVAKFMTNNPEYKV